MFLSRNKILFFLLMCFAGKGAFSQENSSSSKCEIYHNDTINRIGTNGLKQGKWICFRKDGKEIVLSKKKKNQIIEEGSYIDGKKQYVWKSYFYDTDIIKSEITYENNIPKGSVKLYNTDGTIKEEGIFENNQWTDEHYIYDDNGKKKLVQQKGPQYYLEFSGTVTKLGKPVEGAKITTTENQLIKTEFTTSKDGIFNLHLRLNEEFTINFSKSGFNAQSIIVNTDIFSYPDTVVYYLKDWQVNLSDNIGTAATNEVLSLLLNKPVNKINFNRKKKKFDSDGQYVHLFKQQAKLIGKTGEAMLSVAMQENKRLEIENLKVEANNKAKEIELLKKNNEINNAELSKKEIELAKQKLEIEKKEQEQVLLARENEIKKLNDEKQKEAALTKSQLEAERKAHQIEELVQTKKLQDLELQVNKTKLEQTTSKLNITSTELQDQIAKAELRGKEISMLNFSRKAKEQELLAQQLFTRYISFGLGIIILFSLLLYRNFLGKKKANQILKQQAIEINLQKKLVEEKNKGITDSINYAKLIQEAILPSRELKHKLFSDIFVLYKPKDIVSGDFYWFTEKNKKKLIATVDCTGHGVPGAFMSMIGNALLNEIINEKGITSPAEILKHLREKIIDSLKQRDSYNKDGMDISILCFDETNKTVEFAGANNPLWIIRNGEVEEIKGDKQPIGLYHGQFQPFTNHTIELQKGDGLYIFTDGYADQFGGEKGKKFKYKQLQNVLLSIQDKKMADQEKFLFNYMVDWKGDLEQVDDILIIGMRV